MRTLRVLAVVILPMLPLVVGEAQVQVDPQELVCGVPLRRFLGAGKRHSFRVSVPEGERVLVQTSDLSGTIGLLRLRASGREAVQETCSGVLDFISRGRNTLLEVSDCVDSEVGEGDYALTMNVVSDSSANCGRPLDCGATPDGIGFGVAGEVDSYVLAAVEGEEVTFAATDLDEEDRRVRMRLFDPDGVPVRGGESCTELTVRPPATGMYTVLVSACGLPHEGRYRITSHDFTCPAGPTMTYFGVAESNGDALDPVGFDATGRPIYGRRRGEGFSLVIEARTGANGRPVGDSTVADGLPDLQVLVSRPLGDGDPAVCDVDMPNQGGVPATFPLEFSTTAQAVDAINDMGCRFVDGRGDNLGIPFFRDACTSSDKDFLFGFVDPTTRMQFCTLPIPKPWAFPFGDTIVAARVRDVSGTLGAVRQIVVRVEGTPPSTLTPAVTPSESSPAVSTPTPTSTRKPPQTGSPTRTSAPVACSGDCDNNKSVTANELITAVNIALGTAALVRCPAADSNEDNVVEVSDLLTSVGNALDGCPVSVVSAVAVAAVDRAATAER